MHTVEQLTSGELFALQTAIDGRREELLIALDQGLIYAEARNREILADLNSVEKKLASVLDSHAVSDR